MSNLHYYLSKIKIAYEKNTNPSYILETLLADCKSRIKDQPKSILTASTSAATPNYFLLIERLLTNDEKDSKTPVEATSLDSKCKQMLEIISRHFEQNTLEPDSELCDLLKVFMFYFNHSYKNCLNENLQALLRPEEIIKILLHHDQNVQIIQQQAEEKKKEPTNHFIRFFTKKEKPKDPFKILFAELQLGFLSEFLNSETRKKLIEYAKSKQLIAEYDQLSPVSNLIAAYSR